MTKLIVFADDMTGALDTAVQFAQYGVGTAVYACINGKTGQREAHDVIVLNTNTRNLSAGVAYKRLLALTRLWQGTGTPFFYKKTDSALRGNLGSEFCAVMEGSGERRMLFFPAYPQNGRTTCGGVQYYRGVPLCQSELAGDMLSPIPSSRIRDVLYTQMDPARVSVRTVGVDEDVPSLAEKHEVLVFDAISEEDMARRIPTLKAGGLPRIIAGCAGFARFLPQLLELPSKTVTKPIGTNGFLFACGSLNPVSKRQLDYAESMGFHRLSLTPRQKLQPNYFETDAGKSFLTQLHESCRTGRPVIVDVLNCGGTEATQEFADEIGLNRSQISQVIADRMGELIREWVSFGFEHTLMVSGGDTLMGLMEHLECDGILPVCELSDGVVVSRLALPDRELQVVTKSGGFGAEDELVTIWKAMQIQEDNRRKA